MSSYNTSDFTTIVFYKTKEAYGGLSNMASGFPIKIGNLYFRTSEALYQCLKHPDKPELQKQIIGQNSPIFAKRIQTKFEPRPDWPYIRVAIMQWCLKQKLISNYNKFSKLLLSTENKIIVEKSLRDDFWGAKPKKDNPNILEGQNVLGSLLIKLRDNLVKNTNQKINTNISVENMKILNIDVTKNQQLPLI